MSRILTILCAACLIATPALARDDGGFGDAQFPPKAPAALGDYVASSFDDETPANIEPAAGEEEDVQAPEETLTTDPSTDKAPEKADTTTPTPKVEPLPTEKAPQE